MLENPKVDFYFRKSKKWQEELEILRSIILQTKLTEELKWGVPCYSLENKNILLIHEFKEYCAILFFKGALLTDTHAILIQQTKNTQATRQIRFTNVSEIKKQKSAIKNYIIEAIEVEKAGLKVALKTTSEFSTPIEFQNKLDNFLALKKSFNALTPGRQRAYLLYFSSAKQSKTREARIEKYLPIILKGKGLDD